MGEELVLLTAGARAPVYPEPAALRPARLGRGTPAPEGVPVGGVAARGAAGATFTRRAPEADWGLRPGRRCWPEGESRP
jgi:hypothetical protein